MALVCVSFNFLHINERRQHLMSFRCAERTKSGMVRHKNYCWLGLGKKKFTGKLCNMYDISYNKLISNNYNNSNISKVIHLYICTVYAVQSLA